VKFRVWYSRNWKQLSRSRRRSSRLTELDARGARATGLSIALHGRGTYVKIKSLGGVNMWKLNKLWEDRSRLYRSKQASKQGRAVPLVEKRKEKRPKAKCCK
jgi:hypothetical protein